MNEQAARPPGFIGPMLPLQPLVPYQMDEDEDSVTEISSPPPRSTPRKRRRHRLKEPLDEAFLRRSARLNQDHGFKDNASAEQAKNNPSLYVAQAGEASSRAPYLSADVIHGIATGYLKMQPEAASAAALLELDEDDNTPNCVIGLDLACLSGGYFCFTCW